MKLRFKISSVLLILGLIFCLFVGMGSDGCDETVVYEGEIVDATVTELDGQDETPVVVYHEGKLRNVVIENSRISFDLDRNTVLILKIHESGESLVYGQVFELGDRYRIGVVDDIYLESIETIDVKDSLLQGYGSN